jgi:hypothetical protein
MLKDADVSFPLVMGKASRRTKHREYMREYMRKRRATAKALKTPPDTPTAVSAPILCSPKPKSERAQRRDYRASLAEHLEDCLTDPAATCLSGEMFERCRLSAVWMGWFEKLDQLEASAAGKPDLLSELRISIALECLRRLADMKPAAAFALPGIASSFERQGIRPRYPGE